MLGFWRIRPCKIMLVLGIFLLPSVQTGSGAHPASYSMGIRDSFPGGKAVEV